VVFLGGLSFGITCNSAREFHSGQAKAGVPSRACPAGTLTMVPGGQGSRYALV